MDARENVGDPSAYLARAVAVEGAPHLFAEHRYRATSNVADHAGTDRGDRSTRGPLVSGSDVRTRAVGKIRA
jgi:hypothetical protein